MSKLLNCGFIWHQPGSYAYFICFRILVHMYPHIFPHMYPHVTIPIGSMYAIYGNIYHQYTPNVSIYTIHGSYGICIPMDCAMFWLLFCWGLHPAPVGAWQSWPRDAAGAARLPALGALLGPGPPPGLGQRLETWSFYKTETLTLGCRTCWCLLFLWQF